MNILKTTDKLAKAAAVYVELQRTNQADPNFRKVHRSDFNENTSSNFTT